jgi:hypothetical protein
MSLDSMVVSTDVGTSGNNYANVIMKEDISDIIYNLSPTKTPILSMSKRESAHNTTVQWSLDKLADAAAGAGTAEGADAVDATYHLVDKSVNFTQIFQKTVKVSGTMESVELYGRQSEMAYQMTKKSEELKRDIESTICGTIYDGAATSARKAYVGTGATRVMRPLKAMIGATSGAGENNGPPAGYNDTVYTALNGTNGMFDENDINNAMENMWNDGGEPDAMVVNGSVAAHISSLALGGTGAGFAGRYRDAQQETKLVNVVDIYVTPYGELDVVLDRFLNYGEDTSGDSGAASTRINDIFLIDRDYIAACYLRAPRTEQLANTGDNEKRMIVTELTYKVLSPEGIGLITNVDITP